MPKSRIMSAGTVGTNRRIRVNGPEGGGNKLQGLPPICNMRSSLVPYVRTRADGDNRNVVFCINQLSGGVGAKRGQFGPGNRAGVGQTGGCAKPTPPWWYGNRAIIAAFQVLHDFIRHHPSYNPHGISNLSTSFAFIGDHENLKSDHIVTHDGHDPENPSWLFEPLPPATGSSTVDNAINLLNSMKLQFPVNGKMQLHEIGIIGKDAQERLILNGYMRMIPISKRTTVGAFGDITNNGARCAISGQRAQHSCSGAYVGYTFNDSTGNYICVDSNMGWVTEPCLCCNTGKKALQTPQAEWTECGVQGDTHGLCDAQERCLECGPQAVPTSSSSGGGGGGSCCYQFPSWPNGCPICF